MGNGIFNYKGCHPLCCGTSHFEINNNIFGNYGEMELDKDKKIITNIIIPNCELKISQKSSLEKNNIKQNDSPLLTKVNSSKKRGFKTEIKLNKKNSRDNVNSLNKYSNIAIGQPSEKNIYIEKSDASTLNNHFTINKKSFINYKEELLEYLNKMRTTPKLVIEDINFILKNNIRKIENKEYIVSEDTNEIIKMQDNSLNLDKIKDFLETVNPVNSLILNNNLKIRSVNKNIEIIDKNINNMIVDKKKEIIYEFPLCFFYPIFIKDIKLNILTLLSNTNLRDKIYNNKFSNFYVTTFNIKNNRFFAILCFG